MMPVFGLLLTAAAFAAPDADHCTFDFKAVSRRFYAESDGAGNLVTNPNFREKEDPKAVTSWGRVSVSVGDTPTRKAAEVRAQIEKMAKVSFTDGMAAFFMPAEAVDLMGGADFAWSVSTWANKLVLLPNATGGTYRLSMQYRANHTRGHGSNYAYVNVQPVHVDDATGKGQKDVGKCHYNNVRDTGEDADYTRLWVNDNVIPEGANAVKITIRLMGAGYLKFTNFQMTPAVPEKERAPIEFLVEGAGLTDNRFAIESGDVGNLQVNWRRSKVKLPKDKCWVEIDVPKGFAFVGANLADPKRQTERHCKVKAMGEGEDREWSERIRLPLAERFYPWDRDRFYGCCALYLEIRATGPVGTEGKLVYRVIADGKSLANEGSCTLTTVEPFVGRTPKRYRVGAMMTYPQMLLRTGDGANEAFARYMRAKGVTWIMPDTSWIVEDKTLIPMWRKVGFTTITSTDHDYLMNAYHIMGSCPRPPEENYVKRPDIKDNWGIVKGRATCPAAIYEERPFFVTNIVPHLAGRNAGADGLWINWEPHAYPGCCNGPHCTKLFADWTAKTGDAKIVDFHSWQHGELVKTVHKWLKKSLRDVGLMPASSWSALCTEAYRTHYPAEYQSSYFADSVDWLPLWGPYVGWNPLEKGYYGGPYALPRGSPIVVFFAAKDVRENMDRLYKVKGTCPKLIGQQAGANWLIQPEWLEITSDAYLFNRWEGVAPWIFPHGADARFWKAYARSADRAARYEDVVFDGTRKDAATTLTAKPGFDIRIAGFEKAYFPNAVNVPLLQQTTYDYKGVRHVACFNFDDERHGEFILKTTGLAAGDYRVVAEDGLVVHARVTAAELATRGVELTLPVSACRVFGLHPAQGGGKR